MIVAIGLGNPEEKFKETRHNIGFEVIDKFAENNNFPGFEFSKKHNALLSEKNINGRNVILAKPMTFMNNSGIAVKSIIANNKKAYLILVHDDADLPLGKIKIVKNRGSAGHKGVESVIKNESNKNLIRIRVGIQSKTGRLGTKDKFVLGKFSPKEKPIAKKSIDKSAEALGFLLENNLEKAMTKYNSQNSKNG